MNIVMLGAPGSGKGTQGKRLAQHLGIPQVSTGDLLRSAVERGTDLGHQAKRYMDQGLLVPDDIILGLIREVLESPQTRDGLIMDGFPRTVEQAEAVDRMLAEHGESVDVALCLDVDEEELVRRMSGRAREQGRDDDTPETIRKRLEVFWEQTAPLITYYRDQGKLIDVPGQGSVDTIQRRLVEALPAA
jgi:adenylate kinase